MSPPSLEDRILVLAPTGRDGQLIAKALQEAGLQTSCPGSAESLAEEYRAGAAAAVVAEEALDAKALAILQSALTGQPLWSDFPVILLTTPGTTSAARGTASEHLGNVTLVDRPVQIATLVSGAHAALRARRRQYAARDLLLKLADRE